MDPYQDIEDGFLPFESQEKKETERINDLECSLASLQLDYYAILNVAKSATDEEIKDAYKRLSRSFHPDKHADPQAKELAEIQFHDIQTAYEVLSDPTKRTIYDTVGAEGLGSKWEVGPLLKTPEQIIEEYRLMAKRKQEEELRNLINAKSIIRMNINASHFFNPHPFIRLQNNRSLSFAQRLSLIEVSNLYMKHSFRNQLGMHTEGLLSGHMFSRNGSGTGNVVGTLRHTFSSRLWGEVNYALLSPHELVSKAVYNFNPESFLQVQSRCTTMAAPPTFNITAGKKIFGNATGFISFNSGEYSIGPWGLKQHVTEAMSVAAGFTTGDESHEKSLQLQVGANVIQLSANYAKQISNNIKLRANGVVSTQVGIIAGVSGVSQVSEHTDVALGVECGIVTGVSVKFSISRLGQKLSLPILIAQDFSLRAAFWATVVPSLLASSFYHFYLKPERKRKRAEKIGILKEQYSEQLKLRQDNAYHSTELMRDSVMKKREIESSRNGLVVIYACYGHFTEFDTMEILQEIKSEAIIDVTIPIMSLVADSQLRIFGGRSKANLIGFYDPCVGESKRLYIRYQFQGAFHEVNVDDKAALSAPLRDHLID